MAKAGQFSVAAGGGAAQVVDQSRLQEQDTRICIIEHMIENEIDTSYGTGIPNSRWCTRDFIHNILYLNAVVPVHVQCV